MMTRGGNRFWRALGHAWQGLGVLVMSAMLASCGGGEGGTQAGVGSGGTGSYSSGSISTFGSIVVNGTHYDHEAAGVEITALNPDGSTRVLRPVDLKLGMTIEVDEAPDSKVNGVLKAGKRTMRVRSDLIGPVTDLNQPPGTFKVLGQLVRLRAGTGAQNDGGTRYEDEAGVTYNEPFSSMLHNGDVVEVYGHQDVSTLNQGEYIATRVERKALAAEAASVNKYVLRGVVKDLDAQSSTCRIGAASIAYLNASKLEDVREDSVVRITLSAAAPSGGYYRGEDAKPNGLLQADRANATLAGLVTRVVDTSRRQFELNGVPVDAAPAHCSGCAMPELGARLRVEGDLVGGTLQASQVTPISTLP